MDTFLFSVRFSSVPPVVGSIDNIQNPVKMSNTPAPTAPPIASVPTPRIGRKAVAGSAATLPLRQNSLSTGSTSAVQAGSATDSIGSPGKNSLDHGPVSVPSPTPETDSAYAAKISRSPTADMAQRPVANVLQAPQPVRGITATSIASASSDGSSNSVLTPASTATNITSPVLPFGSPVDSQVKEEIAPPSYRSHCGNCNGGELVILHYF